MKPFSRLIPLLLAGLWMLPAPAALAQDFDDDDDLYYSPSRAAEQQRRQAEAAAAAANAAGLGSAEQYTVITDHPLQMDVDTYNRRGVAAADSSALPGADNFSYTRRIQRFHNPDIVREAGDSVAEYYYASPSEKEINLYVINNIDPVGGYSPFYSPYGWTYAWNCPWSWYTPGWQISFRPTWGWGWGWGWGGWYDPFWDYGWGWGPGWNRPLPWYPPSFGGNWGYNRPGASRPHPRPDGSGRYPGGYDRPSAGSGNSWRPGGGTRPGNFGRPGTGNTNTVSPGYNRPGNSGYAPTNNDRRGRNNGGTYNTGNTGRILMLFLCRKSGPLRSALLLTDYLTSFVQPNVSSTLPHWMPVSVS